MQYELQIFEYESEFEFRTVEIKGEPWFVLVDVCRALEVKNSSDAASRLDDDEKALIPLSANISGVRGGTRNMIVINESGLYSLILTSKVPGAKKFKKWVTSEVLPAIRRTGSYSHRASIPAFIRRYNANWDRIDNGYFSVISELTIRLWGRLEQVGHVMADKSPDGVELRPDTAVGRRFADWLRQNHPELEAGVSYYMHETPETEVEARQYPNSIWPLFVEYVDTVWIPQHAEEYFKSRDPKALKYIPRLLPSPKKPKQGMIKAPTKLKRKKMS